MYHLIELQQTASTNAYARENPEALHPSLPTVVWAHAQSQGRGQMGTRWLDEPGQNLTFSVVLRPALEAQEQFRLSMAFALTVARALERHCGLAAQVKWPNDLYHQGRKLGGILIENSLRGTRIEQAICGLGLNVNQLAFPAELPKAGSLALATGRRWDRPALLHHLATAIAAELPPLLAHGRLAGLLEAYHARMYRFGLPTRFERAGQIFLATVFGILPDGRLRLLMPSGLEELFWFKQVAWLD